MNRFAAANLVNKTGDLHPSYKSQLLDVLRQSANLKDLENVNTKLSKSSDSLFE